MKFCLTCPNLDRCATARACLGPDTQQTRAQPSRSISTHTRGCSDCGAHKGSPHRPDCIRLRGLDRAISEEAFAHAAAAQGPTPVQTNINAATHGSMPRLPTDSAGRKAQPIATGVLDYFPLALAAVARLSKIGNDKHNPGEPLNWSRGKSTDHADCILRHMIDRGTIDPDSGELHEVGVAWRALAQLQLAEEKRLGISL